MRSRLADRRGFDFPIDGDERGSIFVPRGALNIRGIGVSRQSELRERGLPRRVLESTGGEPGVIRNYEEGFRISPREGSTRWPRSGGVAKPSTGSVPNM